MRKTAFIGVLTAILVVLAGCVSSPPTNRGNDPVPGEQTAPSQSGAASPGQSESAGDPSECEYVEYGEASRPVELPPMTGVDHTGTVEFTLNTTAGQLMITMDREVAPCTVNSFESLADQEYFDDTECHRMANSGIFILQCGDPTGTGTGGPGYVFADETTPETSYPAGTVAMANSGADTNGSQFFLVFEDSPLPPNYTVFGQLDAESVALLQQIAEAGHDGSYEGGNSGRPNEPVTIESVTKAD